MENNQTIESMATNLAAHIPIRGLIVISGKAGVGKTYLARALCAAWGDQAPPIVEFDALDSDAAAALIAQFRVTSPTLLLMQSGDLAMDVTTAIKLDEDTDGTVDVLVTHYAGAFYLL